MVPLKVMQSELDRDKFSVTSSSFDYGHIRTKYSGKLHNHIKVALSPIKYTLPVNIADQPRLSAL